MKTTATTMLAIDGNELLDRLAAFSNELIQVLNKRLDEVDAKFGLAGDQAARRLTFETLPPLKRAEYSALRQVELFAQGAALASYAGRLIGVMTPETETLCQQMSMAHQQTQPKLTEQIEVHFLDTAKQPGGCGDPNCAGCKARAAKAERERPSA